MGKSSFRRLHRKGSANESPLLRYVPATNFLPIVGSKSMEPPEQGRNPRRWHGSEKLDIVLDVSGFDTHPVTWRRDGAGKKFTSAWAELKRGHQTDLNAVTPPQNERNAARECEWTMAKNESTKCGIYMSKQNSLQARNKYFKTTTTAVSTDYWLLTSKQQQQQYLLTTDYWLLTTEYCLLNIN